MSNKNQIETGSEFNFFSTDGGNNFGIAFDKIFGQDLLNIYNLFEMNSKRNFKNLVPSIIETYEELFLDEGEKFRDDLEIILFDMINVKSKLMINEMTSYDVFIGMLDNIVDSHDKLLIRTIDEYVEKNYALNLDKITQETKDKKKKINEELQFLDKHAKTLIKIAYFYRVMIPIISVYFTYNKSLFAKNAEEVESEEFEDFQFDEINSNIFSYLFEKIALNADAIRNKLYKLTLSRIGKTVYSDKRFWAAAKNQGITKDTEALEIYKKLLTNAIPKLVIDKEKNIVSFFQSVIINQIDFLFQNKFKHKFTILGGSDTEKYSDDDDETSEYERLEVQMLRKDEGLFMVRKLSIKQTLKSIPEYFEVSVLDTEIKSAVKYISRHGVQEKIVSMLTFKYFQDKMAIKFLTFYEYVFLVIATKKYLEKHKFILLPQILTAHCEKHKERTNISGKRIRPLIQDSKKYKDLFLTKYNNFAEEVEKPLSAMIATTYSSIFTNNDGDELFDSTVKVGKVADELIDLVFLI